LFAVIRLNLFSGQQKHTLRYFITTYCVLPRDMLTVSIRSLFMVCSLHFQTSSVFCQL